MKKYDVVSVGAAVVDILIKPKELASSDKEIMLPKSAKLEVGKRLIVSGGGATNSAVGFRKLGLKSELIARIGDDPLSKYVEMDLKKWGLGAGVKRHIGEETDFSVILVAQDGGRTVLTERGKTRLEKADVDWKMLGQTKWLYISSLEGNTELLETLIGAAREEGVEITLNPGSREITAKKSWMGLSGAVKIMLLNRTEAEAMTERKMGETKFWQEITKWQIPIVAVTDGRNGAWVIDQAGKKWYSPILNHQAEDETGAGDAFGTGMTAALIDGNDIETALGWGMKNAAGVVGEMGAKSGLLSRDEIE